ncbi:unnamed protein product [Calicophoron daubneyi]|uniref:Protein phosphatase methylesterase 1 n=1 Tax=Calicophoron daubneyi TaxID=300641 RepID=A0AAV2TP48_CALDB
MSDIPVENQVECPPDRTNCSDHGQHNPYDPVKWDAYFNIRDDIEIEAGTFRIYRRGVEGPLLFFIHGGGFSALTWAVLSAMITEQVKCQCLAVDMRGHGDTSCHNDDDLSVETLSKDVIKIIFAMYPTEAPPIVLVGHSMGGAVAVHVAHKRTIPSLAGLVVIDVVEGSALNSLQGMTAFLRSRPQSFVSLTQAVEWSVRSCQLRNVQSARVSFPGQLKRISTGQTATYELEHGIALISADQKSTGSRQTKTEHKLPASSVRHPDHPESLDEIDEEGSKDGERKSAAHRPVNDHHSNHGSGTRHEYTWRIDLMKTQPFWHEWFAGLSQLFLSIPEPKLLLLAGVDRLDKDLTIGQMQGKFQVHIFPKTGHAVQEDAPDKVAECLARFLVRNRFTEARSNIRN